MENRKKILLIDDEQINLDFFDLMLTRLGYLVFRAENGRDGLDQIRKQNPDLILLDNIMPVMTGWDVIRLLKTSAEYASWRHTPVIMFSALSDSQNKILGYNMGIEDYIVKPFNFGEVLARVKSVIRTHELSAELAVLQKELETAKKQVRFHEKAIDEISQILHHVSKADGADPQTRTALGQCLKKIAALRGVEFDAGFIREEFLKSEIGNSFESLSKI